MQQTRSKAEVSRAIAMSPFEAQTQRPEIATPEDVPNFQDLPGVVSALARLPEDTIISLPALGKIFHRSHKSILRAIHRQELPPPVKMWGKASWMVGAILAHVQGRLDRAARERERMDRKVAALAP